MSKLFWEVNYVFKFLRLVCRSWKMERLGRKNQSSEGKVPDFNMAVT